MFPNSGFRECPGSADGQLPETFRSNRNGWVDVDGNNQGRLVASRWLLGLIGVFQETEEIIGMPTNVHIDKRALLWPVTTTDILVLVKF